MMHKKLKVWAALEGVTAFVLLAVSAAFSFVLFVGFARVPWQVPLYGVLAVGFESTKCLLWIAGIVKDKRYFQVLAICFAVLSLGASATTLLGEAKATVAVAEASTSELASIDADIASTQAARNAYDQKWKDYPQVVAAFDARVDELRARKAALLLSSSSSPTRSANNFTSLASVFSAEPSALADLLRLVYVSLVVVGIEVGGFALSSAALRQMRADNEKAKPAVEFVGGNIGGHYVRERTDTGIVTKCGRIFGPNAVVSQVRPQVVCSSCLKETA